MRQPWRLGWCFVRPPIVGLLVCGAAGVLGMAWAGDRWESPRRLMVETIRSIAAGTCVETKRCEIDPRVLAAMDRVPRHEFVPQTGVSQAYDDHPLPIGHGQTISQPFMVALMTDLLMVEPGQKVLEVGTGSGYQAAILAELGARVFTVEIVPALAASARARLERLGHASVAVREGDGFHGWPEEAPFDAIILTAAAGSIPPPLIEQLGPAGRMVIPVGQPFMTQALTMVEKDAAGRVSTRRILPVVFVPLTGGH